MTVRYSVDSSALIGAWVRRLPYDIVPSFWRKFEELAERGHLYCIDEVKSEIERKDDDVAAWLEERAAIVCPTDEDIWASAMTITRRFPKLTKANTSRSAADPFVIALAEVRGFHVLTDEGPGRGNETKIPDVCREMKIPCLGIYDFARAQGWQF